jgi:hypothetical protein
MYKLKYLPDEAVEGLPLGYIDHMVVEWLNEQGPNFRLVQFNIFPTKDEGWKGMKYKACVLYQD